MPSLFIFPVPRKCDPSYLGSLIQQVTQANIIIGAILKNLSQTRDTLLHYVPFSALLSSSSLSLFRVMKGRINKPLCAQSVSRVQLFATPWAVALQAPLSMRFPGKDTGVGSHFLLQGIFLTQCWNRCLLHWQADSLPLTPAGKPIKPLAKPKYEEGVRSPLLHAAPICMNILPESLRREWSNQPSLYRWCEEGNSHFPKSSLLSLLESSCNN